MDDRRKQIYAECTVGVNTKSRSIWHEVWSGILVSGHMGIWVSGQLGFWDLGYLGIWASGNLCICYLEIWVSCHLGIWHSRPRVPFLPFLPWFRKSMPFCHFWPTFWWLSKNVKLYRYFQKKSSKSIKIRGFSAPGTPAGPCCDSSDLPFDILLVKIEKIVEFSEPEPENFEKIGLLTFLVKFRMKKYRIKLPPSRSKNIVKIEKNNCCMVNFRKFSLPWL